jgi:HPt (histidine-containing phosphotransfer) domain-containing protein
MSEIVEAEPLFENDQLDLLRDALGEEELSTMLLQLPEAAQSIHAIRAALASGDLGETRKAAHVLKGFASSLGAARLSSIAREIELDHDSALSIAGRMPFLAVTIEATVSELPRHATELRSEVDE